VPHFEILCRIGQLRRKGVILKSMAISQVRSSTKHGRKMLWPLLLVAGLSSALIMAPVPVIAAPSQAQGLPDFTELVDRVGPAVVNIRTLERARAGRAAPGAATPFGLEEEILEFWRRFGLPVPNMPNTPRRGAPSPEGAPQGAPQQRGVGSGFILSNDGFIMTNAHVVDGADEVIVTLTDKREFKARIIGADKRTDVAVVKIDATGLPTVRIGDVNRLKVGEWVIAIGSPFGLDNSVTAGIVSAKGRDTGDFLPFIQTDVAINPGNSGGPLINMRGEVVGINSQIYSRSGGFMGISFSIPIDEAIRIVDQLRTSGQVVRGRIGVQIDQVTKEVAESIGLGRPVGALVRSVTPGDPADKAGLEPGDIITRFDGKVIDKASDLPRIVANVKPGQRSTMQVFRRGSYRDLAVTVTDLDSGEQARRPAERDSRTSPAVGNTLGMTLNDLSDAQKRELRVKGGVRVEAVEGAAAASGLREGDVILSLENTEITNARQFDAVLAKVEKSKPVTVLVRRGEWVNFVVIRPTR
jgi:serine protease Do